MSLIIEDEPNKIEFDDWKQIENHNLQQIDKGDIYAFYQLLEYYYDIEDDNIKGDAFEKNALDKLFNIATETQNMKLLSMIAEYYCDTKKYLKMKECCTILLTTDINHKSANISLAEYYRHYDNYEQMIYHYNMINDKTPYLLNKMAIYYKIKKDYDNMIRCYLLSIDKSDTEAMMYLGDYYVKIKDFHKAKLYYEMSLNSTSYNTHSDLIKENLCKLYSVKECFICCIENIHTKFKCGHELCVDCKSQLDWCYYRCS